MPIIEPNPVQLLPPTQSSGGSLKDPANQVRYASGKVADPAGKMFSLIAAALVSAQSQLDAIVAALRGDLPFPNLLQVLDSDGNSQVLLGDMVGPTDQTAYSGLWVLQLFIGGSGPGDPAGTVITVDSSGRVIFGDIIAQNITALQDLQVDGNVGVNGTITSGGDITATAGNISAGGDVSGANLNSAAGIFGVDEQLSNSLAVGGVLAGIGEIVAKNNIKTTNGVFRIDTKQVLGPQRTGWSSPTGTLSRATFDQSTVTLPQLAQRVAALITDLLASGPIGP